MGSSKSKPSTEQPTNRKYHHLGDRGRFLTSRDFFSKRYIEFKDEELLNQFYVKFVDACAASNGNQLAYAANEAFQMALEVIDENPFIKSKLMHDVSNLYLHDVLSHTRHLVDEAQASPVVNDTFLGSGDEENAWTSAGRQEAELAAAGKEFVHNGFFYYLWNSVVGEKFGRNEIKGCRMMAELFYQNARVPLGYHVKYKGRAVTVMALVPINRAAIAFDSFLAPFDKSLHVDANERRTEWDIICMEIAAAVKLKPFTRNGQSCYQPPTVKCYDGLDGRRYMIGCSGWMPRLPPGAIRRCAPQHFVTPLRPIARVNVDHLAARAFTAGSMVHEDRPTIQAVSKLVDVDIHELATADTTNIVAEFRKAGFNYSLLGVLLLSLLRNVTPPVHLVDTVIIEIMARGISEYISDCICPVGDPTRLASEATTEFGRSAELRGLPGEEDTQYLTLVLRVLRECIEYEGDEPPRQASTTEAEVLLPRSLYGGSVIPHIYRKFRLLYDDVNLFQGWKPSMRRAIYGRAVQLMGLRVVDGAVNSVMPILAVRTAPSDAIASWARRRLNDLAKRLLLREIAPRSHWEREGPGLVLLLKLNPIYWHCFDKMYENVARIDIPYLEDHVLAVTPSLEQLEGYIEEEWEEHKTMTAADFDVQHAVVLVRLFRVAAAALHDLGRVRDAVHNLRRARRLCERVFEKGNSILFAPQFRALTQHLREYSNQDVAPLLEMLRLTLKHCPLDVATSFDYITVAAAQLSVGHREEAADNFARARKIAEEFAGPDDPRVMVLIANEAEMKRQAGDLEGAAALLRPLANSYGCPPAALRLCADVLGAVGEPDNAFAATIRAEHEEETVVAQQVSLVYVCAPTGGLPGELPEIKPPSRRRHGVARKSWIPFFDGCNTDAENKDAKDSVSSTDEENDDDFLNVAA